MLTTVVNYKKSRYDVLICRPGRWGNPFVIGRDGDRQEVIRKYREWLLTQDSLMRDIPMLRGKILGCVCKPQDCHGDVLAELANKDVMFGDWYD